MSDQHPLPVRPAEIEKALRGVGLSRAEAKRVLAGGLPALGVEPAEEQQPDEAALVDELRAAAQALRAR